MLRVFSKSIYGQLCSWLRELTERHSGSACVYMYQMYHPNLQLEQDSKAVMTPSCMLYGGFALVVRAVILCTACCRLLRWCVLCFLCFARLVLLQLCLFLFIFQFRAACTI